MKRIESLFVLVLIIVCSMYLYSSFSLPFGSLKSPGPGLLPTIIGCIGLVMSLAWFILAYQKEKKLSLSVDRTEEKAAIEAPPPMRKLLWLVLAIVCYIVAFKFVSPLVNTLVIMIVLAKIFGLEGWKKPLIMGVSFSAFIYVVFVMWFNIQF
ncbi:tripartite tricarboxylate transporter TctB family protein [Desulfitobacterium chlororespirans]|uniref:Tripartite tricarboxylate transporter TctB family protein n=1 Tax=Desulfitobacterium chlororespirans DSM 11544 TaxID=1121395 RepID=A0A1M7S3W7_9FIRM|nr:tripartite tricarboxylate transporter TctB family protein [Desulfitobacterium chlororespirans]SHN53188.1 Tripartite tricarboxylate transporter TctB family protein [Desulfitobacterium chlororespirans DSM 11544]